MKKLITVIVIALSFNSAFCQNVTQDSKGNFIAVSHSTKGSDTGKPTGKTYTDAKGKVYPVLISANGKYYVIVTSKAGNEYKKYLSTTPAKKG